LIMSFHLFSALRAREALRADAITQSDEKKSWFAYSVIGTAYGYQSGYFGLQIDWFLIYEIAAVFIILWIGLQESFRANGADHGTSFIKRIFIIGIPLSVITLAANQVLWLCAWYLFPLLFDQRTFRNPALVWHIFNFACWCGISVWFWWRMHHHISRLNGNYQN
jgi:hypothetical protein